MSFNDWVTACIALRCLKYGLEKFADEKTKQLQEKIEISLATTNAAQDRCSKYTNHIIKKGSGRNRLLYYIDCNICNQWVQEIQKYAESNMTIRWENCDPTLWPVESWEIAKAYMPRGNRDTRRAEDSDISSILSLLIHCTFFHNISNQVLLREVREIRNRIIHSSSLELSDDKLKAFANKMIQILQDPLCLNERPECQEAVEKIKQLIENKRTLAFSKEDAHMPEAITCLRTVKSEIEEIEESIKKFDHDISNLPEDQQHLLESRDHKEMIAKLEENMEKVEQMEKLIYQSQGSDGSPGLQNTNKELDTYKTCMVRQEYIIEQKRKRCSQKYGDDGLTSNILEKENKDWNSILCAISDNMATLADYIHNKVLPNNNEMQKTFSLFKKGFVKKDIFDALCNNICEHIGSQYESRIKRILPSYTSEQPQQLVFVVIVDSEDCELICIEEDYLIETRKEGMFNDEAKDIIHHRGLQQRQLTITESKMLTCTIDKYALELMKKHQNICMVSSCIFKSKGYGSDRALIIPELCIVIYIDIKGFIPIHDEILPASLKVPHTNIDIPTDVRESRYMNYHGGANDFHDHIKMGCMIQGSSFQGTLGGFLEKNNITYALTTAHTFLEDDVLFKTRLTEDGVYKFEDGMQEICVYQNEKKDENKIGHIVYAAINQGDSPRAGVDVAIVQLTDTKRLPVSGQFPTGSTDNRDFTEHEPMKYTSGIIQDKQLFNMQLCNTDAYKFGASTGCTKGKFITPCVYIRQLDFGIPLSRQYEVQPFGSSSFAKIGDSGALVFTKYDGNLSDLRVVGMVEGGTDHNTCIITPIWDIFEQMEIEQRFKSFPDISALELHRQTHQEVQILKKRFDNLEHNTAQILASVHNLERRYKDPPTS